MTVRCNNNKAVCQLLLLLIIVLCFVVTVASVQCADEQFLYVPPTDNERPTVTLHCSNICPPGGSKNDSQMHFCNANCNVYSECLRRVLPVERDVIPTDTGLQLSICNDTLYFDDGQFRSCHKLCSTTLHPSCPKSCPMYCSCVLQSTEQDDVRTARSATRPPSYSCDGVGLSSEVITESGGSVESNWSLVILLVAVAAVSGLTLTAVSAFVFIRCYCQSRSNRDRNFWTTCLFVSRTVNARSPEEISLHADTSVPTACRKHCACARCSCFP